MLEQLVPTEKQPTQEEEHMYICLWAFYEKKNITENILVRQISPLTQQQ